MVSGGFVGIADRLAFSPDYVALGCSCWSLYRLCRCPETAVRCADAFVSFFCPVLGYLQSWRPVFRQHRLPVYCILHAGVVLTAVPTAACVMIVCPNPSSPSQKCEYSRVKCRWQNAIVVHDPLYPPTHSQSFPKGPGCGCHVWRSSGTGVLTC